MFYTWPLSLSLGGISMEQSSLPSNSLMNQKDTTKQKREKIEPVVSGKVKKKGKSFGEKVVDNFINEEVDDVKGYLISDVLVPTVKKTIIDVIKMFFYGRTSGPGGPGVDIVSYNRMSGGRTYLMGSSTMPKRTSRKTFDDIWFENRGDVETVVDNLNEIMATYHVVSVADLFELSNQNTVFTDNRFGWTDLGAMRVIQSGGGYILKMPPPRPID